MKINESRIHGKPQHAHFMKEAVKQAAIALEKGAVPVGAVVVWKNKFK